MSTTPAYTPRILSNSQAAFDAFLQHDFQALRTHVRQPLPIKTVASFGSLPSAVSFDRCLALVRAPATRPLFYVAAGASGWLQLTYTPSKMIVAVDKPTASGGSFSPSFATIPSSAFCQRKLTSVLLAEGGVGATINASGNLVLDNGSYRVRLIASCISMGLNELRLNSISGDVGVKAEGSSNIQGGPSFLGGGSALLQGRFVLSSQSELRIEHAGDFSSPSRVGSVISATDFPDGATYVHLMLWQEQ